jgi:hypothetical protein
MRYLCCMYGYEAWSFTLVLLRTPVAFLRDTSLLRPLGVLLQLRFVLPLLGVLRRMLYRYCYF